MMTCHGSVTPVCIAIWEEPSEHAYSSDSRNCLSNRESADDLRIFHCGIERCGSAWLNSSLPGNNVNLPNSITMSRIVMIPLLLWILSPHFTWLGSNGEQEIPASVLFVLASITDGLDGYLARRRKQDHNHRHAARSHRRQDHGYSRPCRPGRLHPQVVKVWIVVVIIAREFLISGLRSIASSEGFTIQASDLGKLKTVVQIVSVVSAILAHHWIECNSASSLSPSSGCDRRHVLHRAGLHDLGHRLLRGLLEADRPRLQYQSQEEIFRTHAPQVDDHALGGFNQSQN